MVSTRSKVLIVDDDRNSISVLAEALRGEYALAVAKNGQTALDIAASQAPPDLILLDINMPEMDGYEVCRRLKKNEVTASIPVIFATANSEMADEKLGLDLGAVDYVTKPYRLPIVLARVRTHIELKRKTDMLERLSTLDGLTRINNRRFFDTALHREWADAKRKGKCLSLILLDIDHFKLFNDTYGHGAGDECLRKVASALQHAARRPRDVVARYGGEEFVILLPETMSDGAGHAAESIRKQIEAIAIPHLHSPVSDVVTVSLGVASLYPAESSAPEVLVETADQAMYLAKEESRNTVKLIDLSGVC